MHGDEWAEAERILSREVAAEHGRYDCSRAAYQREWMRASTDETTELVCLKTSAQVGKTTVFENVVGYFTAVEPAPMLLIWPTLEDAEELADQRITPLYRDTPALERVVAPLRVKDGSTKLYRRFPGGFLSIGGANSPRKLAARSIRIFIGDEVDRWPLSVGDEGDPLKIGPKRTRHFWNRKILLSSTPTLEGRSKISRYFLRTTQEYFYVPCPHCETFAVLRWSWVHWDTGDPSSARLVCPTCGAEWTEGDRLGAVREGEYRAHNPECPRPWRGFHISELYSHVTSIAEMVDQYEDAEGDFLEEQAFINLSLGEEYRPRVIDITSKAVRERRESYSVVEGDPVPAGVAVVVAAVDVQQNRVEVEFVGYGRGSESWGLGYLQIMGSFERLDTRKEIDRLVLNRTFEHPSGVRLRVLACAVDSGYLTHYVHRYCKARSGRRVYAIRGVGDQVGRPFVGIASDNNPDRCLVFPLNVSVGKQLLMTRLTHTEPGPGFCHFPEVYPDEYFDGLVSEKLVERVSGTKRVQEWVKIYERNEPLDIRVYTLAAIEITRVNLAEVAARLEKRASDNQTDKRKGADDGNRKGRSWLDRY